MFKRISIIEAKQLIDTGDAQIVDIRDEQSFQTAHIPCAIHLDQSSLQTFIESADVDKPVLVCCYHGNSSQSAADFLNSKGFEHTFSIDGGIEAWKLQYPTEP
jgi:thiosulfate sulfurtransferase